LDRRWRDRRPLITWLMVLDAETDPERSGFATAVTIVIASLLALLSGRLLFASIVTLMLVTGIYALSTAKMAAMNMSLHAYDLFFYLDAPTLAFLWTDYRADVIGLIAGLAGFVLVAAILWRVDTVRWPRLPIALTLVAAISAAAWYEPGARSFAGIFHHVRVERLRLAFLSVLGRDAADADLGRHDAGGCAHATWELCAGRAVHAGRQTSSHHSHSPGIAHAADAFHWDHLWGLEPFFLSDDGLLHQLHVETYGGGSWLTDFSLLAGVSTRSFGDMRPFLQIFLQGRLKETVPQYLTTCGYQNVLIFPMSANFISMGKFYTSIGFPEIIDMKAQKAPTDRERDRFYFQSAADAMEKHLRSSNQPLFVYIQTMAAHGPYSFTYMPEENVPGGSGPSTYVNEYLRRVDMAKRDGDFFIAELKRRFPNEPILVVRYGDHQPGMPELISLPPFSLGGLITEDRVPIAFRTFYAMSGLNYKVPDLPNYDMLDISYLGTVMIEAAGLPLSEAQRERKRLMAVCDGLYFGCDRSSDILAFNRRLINSGLVLAQ